MVSPPKHPSLWLPTRNQGSDHFRYYMSRHRECTGWPRWRSIKRCSDLGNMLEPQYHHSPPHPLTINLSCPSPLFLFLSGSLIQASHDSHLQTWGKDTKNRGLLFYCFSQEPAPGVWLLWALEQNFKEISSLFFALLEALGGPVADLFTIHSGVGHYGQVLKS